MILKGSQRGGGMALGKHLLNTADNEHVEVHEVRGFVAQNVMGAMKEAHAVSRGTKCKQHLFSVSLNPPETENPPLSVFESALARIEQRTGLAGQPRIVVFHEKEGRRHCHAAWSRIDAEEMKAVNMAFFKTKLREVSKEIYLEQGWKMPRGLMDSKTRDPLKYSLEEYQQAKRMGRKGSDLKALMAECWAVSDSRESFEAALKERGLYLAKGDRRGFVALSIEKPDEALSIARYTGKKTKDIKARLGEPDALPSLDEQRAQLARSMEPVYKRLMNEAREKATHDMAPLERQRLNYKDQHAQERAKLDAAQKLRWEQETRSRAEKLNHGLQGFWDRLSGKRSQQEKQNQAEAWQALERDRAQRHDLLTAQLNERQNLQARIRALRQKDAQQMLQLHRDKAANDKLHTPESDRLAERFNEAAKAQARDKTAIPAASAANTWAALPNTSSSPQERLSRLRSDLGNRPPSKDKGPEIER